MEKSVVALPGEIKSFYVVRFVYGIGYIIRTVLFPLLVDQQTKYLASLNPEGIEWRHKHLEGPLCDMEGVVKHEDIFMRPAGLSEDCYWFPVNKIVPGTKIQYSNVAVYALSVVLIGSGLSMVTIGPLGDFGNLRWLMLMATLCVWGTVYSCFLLITSSSSYLITLILGMIGSTSYIFSLRSLLNAYIPMLAFAHHEIADFVNEQGQKTEMTEVRQRTSTSTQVQEFDHLEEGTNLLSPGRQFPAMVIDQDKIGNQDAARLQKKKEQVVAGLSMDSGSMHLLGSFLGFIVQVLIVFLSSDDPKDTSGLRRAIAVGALFSLLMGFIGISGLEKRTAPGFPSGRSWWSIGIMRTVKSLRKMRHESRNLWNLLAGRSVLLVCVNTIHIVAPLFIGRAFGLKPSGLMKLLLVYMAAAVPSAVLGKVVLARYPGQMLNSMKGIGILCVIMPLYYLFGLKERYEIYWAMVISAAVFSPLPGISWALTSEMIPAGYNATIMSLEGVLENLLSGIGPLIVGATLDMTGSIRLSIASMSIFALGSLPFFYAIDMDAARKQKKEVDARNAYSSTAT